MTIDKSNLEGTLTGEITDEREEGKVTVFTCERPTCGHKWVPRHPLPFEPIDPATFPSVCPKCKNPDWNRPAKLGRRPRTKAE